MCFQIGLAGGAGIQHSLDKGFLGEGLQGAGPFEDGGGLVGYGLQVGFGELDLVQSHGQPHGGVEGQDLVPAGEVLVVGQQGQHAEGDDLAVEVVPSGGGHQGGTVVDTVGQGAIVVVIVGGGGEVTHKACGNHDA